MDRIKMMLDNMENLSDEELAELQTAIVSEFETVETEEPTPQTVEAMTSLADMLDTVRGEFSRREVQATELAQQATEAADRVYGKEGEDETAVEPTENPEETAMENYEEKPAAPAEETVETAPAEEPTVEIEVETKEEEKEGAMQVADEVTLSADPEEAPAAADETAAAPAEGSELSTQENESEIVLSEETPNEAPAVVQEEIVEAPVTAAASNADNFEIEVPADRRPVVNEIPVAITAGADIPGVTAGSDLKDMTDVADAFAKRLHGLRRVNGGDGEQHIVASFSTQYPESLQLGTNAEENWAKIQEVAGPNSLVASGSYQSPYSTRYEIFGIGSNARPVRDSFPSFQADRGGIRYIVPPVLSSYGSAVGVWTTALDTAYVTDSYVSSATKDSLVVQAAQETTAVADAVTLQMQFGNLATRAYPELIARHNELGLIQHAREAEQYLVSKLSSASTAVTTTSVLGLAADFMLQIGRAASAYRARHRMEADATLRVIAPVWV